ncbi:ABC transporter family substrate-binding protein [Streptomyces sp. 6N223]|uniref:ABC transporter family substrate-binding protein n=1 Tax=Streptomyces sp. 6N223 TaxID=3457412 RepID=UPI003FD33B69
MSVPARRAAALLAAALLTPATPLLAGCTGSDEREGSASVSASQSVAVARRAQLTSGGTVTWGVDELPDSLNAYHEDAGPVTEHVAGAVLPMLFTLDARGRPRLNTDYLRTAEITDREPRQRVVYTLHPKAAWSDGEPIGVEDFHAQWRALSGQDTDYAGARAAGYERIESVAEGPGPRQVTVTFARPYADWRSLFSPLYPRSVTSDPGRFNEGARQDPPPAGGPFAVESVDREAGTITLARNEEWWGRPALLDELVFAAVPGGRRQAALLAGELDLAEVSASDAERITAAAESAPGAQGPGPLRERGAVDTAAAMHAWATARLTEETGQTGETGESGSDDSAAAERARERYARTLTDAERARELTLVSREAVLRERLRDFAVYRAYDAGYTQLTLNGASPALRDERVRWALARAIDREALAEEVHEPAGLPAEPLGSHLRTVGQAGYQDNSEALGDSGTTAAAALLEEAGWELAARPGTTDDGANTDDGDPGGAEAGAGDGRAAKQGRGAAPASPPLVRTKQGEALELRFLVPDGPGSGQLRATGRRIVTMLEGIGVSADLTEVPAEDFFAERVPGGDFDLALYSWPATAYPATDAQPLFAKPQALPGGQMLVGQNYTRLGTDYIDQLLRQAAGELDEAEHAELLNKADARLWAVAGSIPLYQPPQLVAARADLAGVGAHGMATPRYQDIGYRR